MKPLLASMILAASLVPAAQAQQYGGTLKPFVGIGLTFGGEDLATAEYSNGSTYTVTTGGLVDFRAGLEYRLINSPWALQAVLGYHTDSSNATNGKFQFSRIPVELIAMADMSDQWRIGFGLRKASSAKVSTSGDAVGQTVFGRSTTFVSNLGVLFQAEYRVTPNFGLQARYVNERYQIKFSQPQEVDGSHAGIFGVLYFP